MVLMTLSSELDAARVDVGLASELVVDTKSSAKTVETWAAVRFTTRPEIVELLQIGATVVYEAPKPVSPRLGASLVDRAVPWKDSVGNTALTVDVVLQTRYSDPVLEGE
jgi:hypothetical protein